MRFKPVCILMTDAEDVMSDPEEERQNKNYSGPWDWGHLELGTYSNERLNLKTYNLKDIHAHFSNITYSTLRETTQFICSSYSLNCPFFSPLSKYTERKRSNATVKLHESTRCVAARLRVRVCNSCEQLQKWQKHTCTADAISRTQTSRPMFFVLFFLQ